jgi:hypothetical protein
MVEYIAAEQASESEEEEEPPQETDPATQRKLPWLIDIFLYPFNWSGLKHLVLFILVPYLLDTIEGILPYLLAFMFCIASYFVKILIFLYIYWYLAECVRESASGWVRAPQGFGGFPTLKDMLGQVVNIIGCLAFFLGPFALYAISAGGMNIISWILLGFAVFLYPMGLLSVLIHDSVWGLNFRMFLKSISNTFYPYRRTDLINPDDIRTRAGINTFEYYLSFCHYLCGINRCPPFGAVLLEVPRQTQLGPRR